MQIPPPSLPLALLELTVPATLGASWDFPAPAAALGPESQPRLSVICWRWPVLVFSLGLAGLRLSLGLGLGGLRLGLGLDGLRLWRDHLGACSGFPCLLFLALALFGG